jgi:hypothetical protein
MVKPLMAIPRLMAKAYCHHAECAALAIKRKKKVGKLLLLGHFCTRANDNKSLIKQSLWLSGLNTHQSPELQEFNPYRDNFFLLCFPI